MKYNDFLKSHWWVEGSRDEAVKVTKVVYTADKRMSGIYDVWAISRDTND